MRGEEVRKGSYRQVLRYGSLLTFQNTIRKPSLDLIISCSSFVVKLPSNDKSNSAFCNQSVMIAMKVIVNLLHDSQSAG